MYYESVEEKIIRDKRHSIMYVSVLANRSNLLSYNNLYKYSKDIMEILTLYV